MRICILLLGVTLMFLLNGCDVARGPVIFNDTDHVIEITARFADGPSQVRLDPHQAYWQLKRDRVLESLVVIEHGQRREINGGELQSLLKRAITPEDALLLLHEGTVDMGSIQQAKEQGFFNKR